MRLYLHRIVLRRPWLAFLSMGICFLLFGVTSFNLIVLLRANLRLWFDYGTMVIADGALVQLLQLIAFGYASLAFYVLFKACEHALVERLVRDDAGARTAKR